MRLIRSVLRRLHTTGTTTKICRTRRIGDCFFECKVKRPDPKYCDFSQTSGGRCICKHRDRKKFSKK